MGNQPHNDQDKHQRLTADILKGKQSVRATFRLPSDVIELLSLVANQLGIKQKSLFDQLVEDRNVLDTVANMARQYQVSSTKKLSKTYVLSRNSLSSLDEIAREYNLPRDVLVEISINRLQPVISAEQEKHKKRKSLMANFESFLHQGRETAVKARELLEGNDPFLVILEALLEQCEKRYRDLGEVVLKGECADRYTNDDTALES